MTPIERLERDVPTPRIHPSFTPVEVSPDEVQFRVGPWSGPVYTIQDDDGDGEVRRLVRALDGTTPVREIVADFEGETREQVVSILAALATADVTPVAFDVTTRDVADAGLRVTKVVVPELVPLTPPALVPTEHPAFDGENVSGKPHPFP